MVKVNAVLITMLLTCALLLVTSQHRARKAFIDLDRAQAAARKHDIEWNHLQLEQTQLAKHSLIDATARRELKMLPVGPDRTLYVDRPVSVATAPANDGAPAGSVIAVRAPR